MMEDILHNLILSYQLSADDRDRSGTPKWKKDLRWKFLDALKAEGRKNLIDLGAGTGIHGKFFQDQGIDVTCIDLVPAHIEKCTEKGLRSFVLDFFNLSKLGQKYAAGFAFNSLLHTPIKFLPDLLNSICRILEPEALFFWGQYGGEYREGVYQEDHQEPKRFFALLNDAQILELAEKNFKVIKFDRIEMDDAGPLSFQSMLLRVKA